MVFKWLDELKNKISGKVEVKDVTTAVQSDRHIPVSHPNIKIDDIRDDAPEFGKTYAGKLSNNARVELTARCWFSWERRSWTGSLTQPNGNSISFDPDRIADKIIDPVLVPLVKAFVDASKQLDAEFMNGPLNSLVDNKGGIWKKAGKVENKPAFVF